MGSAMQCKWLLALAPWLLANCGTQAGDSAEAGVDPFSPSSIPPELRGGGTPISPDSGIPQSLKDDTGVVLNQDEIVFTDPDAENPEEIPTELKDLLSAAPTEGPWRRSYKNTFKEARQTGKPVLMWFTDSQASPNCRMLSEELFSQKEFEEWAGENFVRLQLDQRVQGSKLDNEVAEKASFIRDLKKRYKILGQPTLLVLTPAGEVIGRYKGYRRGQADFKWGQLKQAALLAGRSHEQWREKLEKKGYRNWSDPRGRSIFAKLVSYRDGRLILVEPDGTRAKTKESQLSSKDQEWIAEQKKLRGME